MTKTIGEAAEVVIKKATKRKPRTATRADFKLLDAGDSIFAEPATEKDAAYIARELVQCTLPHKNPPKDKTVWTRKNGNLTLAIQSGYNIKTGEHYGIPYGTAPRLVLFWITTEAVRTKSRRLDLGSNLAGFMHELGLDPSRGGKRSDAKRLKEQMERLFRAKISFDRTTSRAYVNKKGEIEQHHGKAWLDMQVAPKGELWWDEKEPEQTTLWGSWIELGEDFYTSITAAPVPVDVRALKALKKSPLALDLYAWLSHESYRAHKSGEGRFISWSMLMEQLGTEYTDPKNFGTKAKAALRKVLVVYPALRLGDLRAGVRIDPQSFPAIKPREQVTIEGKAEEIKDD